MRSFLRVFLVSVLVVAVVTSIGLSRSSSKSSRHAWLGVVGQSVDEELADAFDLGADYGAIINRVLDESPAEEAGLEEGDLIVKFEGQHVGDWDDLVDMIEDHRPGDEVDLVIFRDEDQMDIKVTLDSKPRGRSYRYSWFSDRDFYVPKVPRIPKITKLPRIPRIPRTGHFYIGDWSGSYIGVHMMELNKQLAEYFGVEKGRGVLITEVDRKSPAENAGLAAGDVIIEIDGDRVFEHEDVTDAIDDADPGDKLSLMVIRDKKELSFDVEVGEKNWDWDDNYYHYSAPDIDLHIPDMKGLRHGVYLDALDDFHFDAEEFEDAMEDLEDELEELREEMEEIDDEEREELREELEELREELEELEDDLD
ncbi:MAG: PDZ domain-containing protein [Candidatus Zixiibacteriota bacterium]|nr:MAG: PDZ domain-containing protein [candidate division Zixibacteria bacterium]